MGDAVSDLVSAAELWQSAAAGLVAILWLELVRRRSPGLSRPRARLGSSWSAPALSVVAAFAAYACVPDTERAVGVLGATGTAAVVTVLLRRPWPAVALVVTVALVWVALEDGPPRDSALVGTLAIAALHVVLQHRAAAARRAGPAVVALGAVAMGLAARVAGRGDGIVRPVLLAGGLIVATVFLGRFAGSRSVPA